MNQILNFLQLSLQEREEKGVKRTLRISPKTVDFFSNDYLGFARNKVLHQRILEEYNSQPELLFGSTGARLISGNTTYMREIEQFIAEEHQTEAALLFSSGYTANLALFSALLKRNDVVLVDENIHRSVHDGCRLSFAKKIKFRHNDLQHLESLLQKVGGRCFIAVESLYSMDGDLAPLTDMCGLAKKYGAALIVDEAHAFGVFGYGLVHKLGLQNEVFATVITYGKSMGMNGAVILSNQLVIDYLVNYASPFIYTTAMPHFHVSGLRIGYEFFKENDHFTNKLQENLVYFHSKGIESTAHKQSPVQILKFQTTAQLRVIRDRLEEANLHTFAVFPPTVREGEERLRVCIHAFNTKNEIAQLTEIIRKNE